MSDSTSKPSPISGSASDNDSTASDDLTADCDLGFDGAEDILRSWRKGMRPDPDLTVPEWADAHRWLSSRAAAEPGRYRTARAPYLREIIDALSPRHPAQRISFMKAAQVGTTEAGNNWIGFVIHHAPGPMLVVLPTVEMAKRTSRGRLDPLIAESPVLRALVNPARSRDAGNSMLSKEFQGGILVLTGANSATGLRSMPSRYIFLVGRCLSGLGRRGRRSGHAGRSPDHDLLASSQGVHGFHPDHPGHQPDRARIRGQRPAPLLRDKTTARARTSVEKRFPEFPFVMTYLPSFTLSGKPGLVQLVYARICRYAVQPGPQSQIRAPACGRKTRQSRHRHAQTYRNGKCFGQS